MMGRRRRREALQLAIERSKHHDNLRATDKVVEEAKKFERYLRDGVRVIGSVQ